jgi:hypothetical protein
MKLSLFIIMSFLCAVSIVYAETPLSANLKVYEVYIDNLFQTSTPDSDYVTLMNLNASFDLSQNTSTIYSVDVNLFNEYSDLHNQTHSLSINHKKAIFDEQGILYFGGRMGLRDNTSEYAYNDYRSAGAYSNLKYYLTQTAYAQAEYQIKYENHQNYQNYTSFENYGSIQTNKSFSTKTTLQARFEAGRRDYVNFDDNRNVNQVTGFVKVAQSLTDLTGLQLQYRWHNTTQRLPYFIRLLDSYNQMDDQDDEYAYSGSQWQLTLKSYTMWNMMIKSVFTREKRSYNPAIAIENPNVLERNDTITAFLLGIDKKISTQNRFIPESTLSVEFMHRRNNSSDPYYKSSTNILSIGTAFTF